MIAAKALNVASTRFLDKNMARMYSHFVTEFNTVNSNTTPISAKILLQTDAGWWVDKPAGWLTVDASRDSQVPVLGRWLERETNERVWPTHRLDVETSGVVFFARNPESHRKASMAFENHEVGKEYVFIAKGSPFLPSWIEKSAIRGQSAVTQFEVIERFGDRAFYAIARPQTGRRHQIRIHLQVKGHPILGDTEYGGTTEIANRVALHARRLSLPGEKAVEAALPEDFSSWLRTLKEASK